MLRYVAKLQKWSYFDEFASIWRQNDQKRWGTSQNIQNNAKLQNWSNYNELHRFDVKTIKPFELGRKTTKVIKLECIASIWCHSDQNNANYKRDQITMNLHRFDVKTIKNVEVRRKTTKLIKLQWIASICCQNDRNFWVRSQNYKSDLISMNLHRFEVKTIKNVEVRRKTFKTTQNYKTDQITMKFIDLTSKRSKLLS